MSTTHRLKKIKPPDLEQQHNIRKFITDCTKVGLLPAKGKGPQPKSAKKQWRSTGDKNKSSKCKQDTSGISKTACEEVQGVLNSTKNKTESKEIQGTVENMSTVSVTPQMGDPTSMLTEIKKMEVRLTASIKETLDKEMSDMEERLSNIIRTSINETVKGIQNSLNTIV